MFKNENDHYFFNVRNCQGRQQKYTNQFMMYMIISGYQKGWLKKCK